MKIIITKYFEKNYLKKFKKYFSLKEFLEIIETKQHTFISLHEPFFKFKNNINWVAFRWIIFISIQNNLVPLSVFLKKDKKLWENISWQTTEDIIEKDFEKTKVDIKNWDYEIFEF